ncbi:MAG: hypothetical protein V4509_00680 [Patescibacteria group bacterium]
MSLSSIYKQAVSKVGGTAAGLLYPTVGLAQDIGSLFRPRTQQLPNGGGSYTSPTVNTQPVSTNQPQTQPAGMGGGSSSGGQQGGVPTYVPDSRDPAAIADAIAKSVSMASGDIPAYSATQFKNPNPSSIEAASTASELNNTRNDIATGATDPYKWASQSKIPYTASELGAIEKAGAGIYDPAINSALARLDMAQKTEAKKAAAGGSLDVNDPTVQAYVKIANANGGKLTGIPAGYKNAVALALSQTNVADMKDSGMLDDLTNINSLLNNKSLSNISGPLDQYIGGAFGGEATKAKDQFNQLDSLLQLANSGKLKGQGQISDAERAILKAASNSVKRGQNDTTFRQGLIDLRGVLLNRAGQAVPATITSPNGQTVKKDVTREDVNDAVGTGSVITYNDPTAVSKSEDPYASFRSQLQPGEILVNRDGHAIAVQPAEKLPTDIQL